MFDVRPVPEADVEAVHRMRTERVGDLPLETVRKWYREAPELFLGAYDQSDLVGFCLGREREEGEVEVDGIAVERSHLRRGIGTALLSAFEERAAALGYGRVSLGSAGGYVDEFYLQNGYEPASVLVRVATDDLPSGYRDLGYEIVEETVVDGTTKLYVEADEHDPELVEEIRAVFDDPSAVYVMEKRV